MENKKDLGAIIKKRLTQSEVKPPHAVWENIQLTLHNKKKRKAGYIWLTSILGILGLGLFFILTGTINNQTNNIKTANPKSIIKSKDNPIDTINNAILEQRKAAQKTKSQQENTNSPINSSTKKPSILGDKITQSRKKQSKNSIIKENGNTTETDNKKTIQEGRFSNTIKLIESPSKDTLINDQVTKRKKKETLPVIDSVVSIKNNFYAYPFISATRFGKLGQTSTIDPLLDENRSSSTFHMGYGAYLIFELDKKMRLRMGGAINNMERNTFDVRINPLVAGTNYYRNIAFKDGFSYIFFLRIFENIEDITLKEKLTNIEVPIELTYLLIDKRFGLDGIIGVNITYHGENKVFAIRENGESIYLGKNNNYTSFGFGLNIGSGLHYKINESIRFNFEAIWSPRFNMLEENKKTYPNIFIIQTGLQYKIN